MKATIEKLPIMLVYAIKYVMQPNMLTGRSKNVIVPTGEVHIFQIASPELGTIRPYSMCGKESAEIGEHTKTSDKRPAALPMCQKCETEWKKHPESPWRAWEKGIKAFMPLILALALASIACLQTTAHEEADSASAGYGALLPTEGTPFEHPEQASGAVYELPTPKPMCAIVTADEALHLRTGPTETAEHIEYLTHGQELDILVYGSWWKVRTDGGAVGYANARYLQAELCT